MNNKNEMPNYYAIIPAFVRYDKSLNASAKLLYGEITALTNKKGVCWASNAYFAELYGVSKKTISIWIKNLIDNNYIISEMIYKKGSKEIEARYIQLCNHPTNNITPTYAQNSAGPMHKNVKDSITSNNTVNIIDRKLKFSTQAKELNILSKEEVENFISYWCEKNPKGKKMKFEKQNVFDISRRLNTWKANTKKFAGPTEEIKLNFSSSFNN